jgi:glycosyltransferase involved in cell wall biosynthesis
MRETRVTIVTPSFNQGDFVEETILSVLQQTYSNIEYIVVDGGSTDCTNDILQKYQDQITLIQGQDEGQTDAINIGFRKATGDLVGWLNSDDVLETEAVERIVEAYEQNSDASIYYGYARIIDSEGDFIGFPRWGRLTYDNLVRGRPCLIQQGSFYPRHYIEQVGYLDASLRMAMDVDLFLKLLKLGEAEFIPEFLARIRVYDQTKTSRYQGILFRETIRVRLRNGMSIKWLPLFVLKKTLHLSKLFLVENGIIRP